MSGIDVLIPIDACRHQVLHITAETVLGVPKRNAAILPAAGAYGPAFMVQLRQRLMRVRSFGVAANQHDDNPKAQSFHLRFPGGVPC